MTINYDIPKINKTLENFYNATGVNMDLFRDDFTQLGNRSYSKNIHYCNAIQNTVEGSRACRCADIELLRKCKESGKTERRVCRAGLVDIASPIMYENELLGFVIFGQMKTSTDFSEFKSYIDELGLNTCEMQRYYDEISLFNADKIESVSEIATMLIRHILLENMLKPSFDDILLKAISYIDANLEKNISLQELAEAINVSKSVLYRRFHAHFDCTVGEFINSKRIEKATSLLENTSLSLEEISQRVGFTNASYFTKIFKKLKATTPLKYRKSAQ